MSNVRCKIFVINLWQGWYLVLLHLDILNPVTWWSALAVDSDKDRVLTSAESSSTTLPCRSPLGL